jgi:hypothetical protein
MTSLIDMARRRTLTCVPIAAALWLTLVGVVKAEPWAPLPPAVPPLGAPADPLAGLDLRAELLEIDTPFKVGPVRMKGKVMRVRLSAPGVDPVWAMPGQILANGWELIDVEPDAALLLSPRGIAVRVLARRGDEPNE